ncbi:MAG: hypothetical protein R2730_01210 [Chitinophagales bacterium]
MKFAAQKILVVGTSCSGKSTLAKQLAAKLKSNHFDLDDFHWLPNWVEKSDECMVHDLEAAISPLTNWIISGNYTHLVKDVLWTKADTIIWLDYSFPLIMLRFFKRSIRRIVWKEACCNGNYETFYNSFIAKDNLFSWILKSYPKRKKQFNEWRKGEFGDKNWMVLKTPLKTEVLYESIQQKL